MDYPKQTNFITRSLTLMAIYSLLMFNVFVSNTAVSAQSLVKNEVASTPSLDRYTTDLTAQAENNRLTLSGRFEKEVDRLVETLSNTDFRQPALLDELGESQELVVEILADRIAKGIVPAALQNKRVLVLEIASLFEGAKSDDEITSRMQAVVNELVGTKGNTILFVNEMTNFVGDTQVNDLLASSIVNKQLNMIGGSSREDYLKNVDSNADIAALFDPIIIGGGEHYGFRDDHVKVKRYRGDNVSSDIRELMKTQPGDTRLDVIMQTKGADNPELRSIMAQYGVRFEKRIGNSDTIVVNMPLSAVEAISNSGLSHFLSPNRELMRLGHIERATGASYARSIASSIDSSLNGSGVGIAIVDSGMKADHKAFLNDAGQSRVVYSADFTDENDPDDGYGHGTHVAGIAAGNSDKDAGAYRGIAPDADILNLKALNSHGTGSASWLLAALDWIAQNHAQYNIRVVNLSLGGLAVDSYTNDPVNLKVQDLNALGILVVAAAGNEGKNAAGNKLYGHIHSPGNDPSALTVGAVNTHGTDSASDDGITSFSSRGPTRSSYVEADGTVIFDNAIKP
ncbi:MAG: S8 family serine peptidase, partial [Acidobacteriota bacterium]|nr:S8 family serine peptidase [Acidobacteriota bacterium]